MLVSYCLHHPHGSPARWVPTKACSILLPCQGHSASRWQSQESKPMRWPPESLFLTTTWSASPGRRKAMVGIKGRGSAHTCWKKRCSRRARWRPLSTCSSRCSKISRTFWEVVSSSRARACRAWARCSWRREAVLRPNPQLQSVSPSLPVCPISPAPVPCLTWTSALKARNRSSVSCRADSESPGMAKLTSCCSPGPESHCST